MNHWVSPEGITHIYEHGLPCYTCGRSHGDQVDEIAREIAQGIISEADGNYDLAINIINRAKQLLDGIRDPVYRLSSPVILTGADWTFDRGFITDTNIPRFGATDYSEDWK